MRKVFYYLIAVCCLSFTLMQTVFEKNNQWYKNQVDEITSKSLDFLNTCKAYSRKLESEEVLKDNFLSFRRAYKKAEFLIEYFDHEFVSQRINGAPLPKLMKKIPEITVVQPQGFQVIEEIVFAEKVDTLVLLEHAEQLAAAFKELNKNHSSFKVYDRQVFEAARFQIIRIMSMGITGFDTPCTDVSIQESYLSLAGTWVCLKNYAEVIGDKKLKKQYIKAFESAISYLQKHQEFELFDRLEFIRDFLNPVYSVLADVQKTLNIESVTEVGLPEYAISYEGKDLFGKRFFNDNYFVTTRGTKSLDSLKLLGQYLFFDPVLSANNERACASCHNPKHGFASDLAKNEGFNHEGVLDRNTPTLLNVVYAERFFYDLRASKIEEQVQHVVFNQKEFNTSFYDIKSRIIASEEYMQLFEVAFPHVETEQLITKHTISKALSVYMLSLKSNNSKFDKYMRKETEEIEASVKNGFNLFMGKAACGTCHFAPMFNGTVPPYFRESESEVLGVPENSDKANPVLDPDGGRGVTGVIKERNHIYYNSFKTPTVRNAAITAPYMHNGVFKDLHELMDFYNNGGGIGLGLDISNQTLPADSLGLTEKELNDLVTFVESLTDTTHLTAQPMKLPSIKNKDGEEVERYVGGLY